MNRRSGYPQEVRERAVRMVFEHTPEYGSQWAAIRSIPEVFGTSPETLRIWARWAEAGRSSRSPPYRRSIGADRRTGGR